MPPKKEGSPEHIKNQIKGHLGNLAKQLEQWEKAIQLAEELKQTVFINRMRAKQDTCEEVLVACRNLTTELNGKDPEGAANNDDILERWQTKYDKVADLYHEAERKLGAKVETQPDEPDTERRSRAVRPKANDPMTPWKLPPDAKPSMLRAWKKRFEVWYNSHYMKEMDRKEQQLHFLSCLTPVLEARMQAIINDTTEVLPQGDQNVTSCMELLEKEFLQTYPLVNRRHEFFSCTQGQNQNLTDFVLKLRELAIEADLDSLNQSDLILFRALAGTSNQEFQREFLRASEHTLEKLDRMAKAFETTDSAIRGFQGPAVSRVNKMSPKPDGMVGKATGPAGGKGNKDVQKPCWRCLKPHNAQTCKFRSQKCHNCQEVGHIGIACPNKSGEKDQKSKSAAKDEGQEETSQSAAIRAITAARARGEFARVTAVSSTGNVQHTVARSSKPEPQMDSQVIGTDRKGFDLDYTQGESHLHADKLGYSLVWSPSKQGKGESESVSRSNKLVSMASELEPENTKTTECLCSSIGIDCKLASSVDKAKSTDTQGLRTKRVEDAEQRQPLGAEARHDGRKEAQKLLAPGTNVILQDMHSLRWDVYASIEKPTRNGRSYLVRLLNGKMLYRGRRYIRKPP